MLALVICSHQRLAKAVDQVALLAFRIGAVKLTGLLEVLLAADPLLLSAAAQGQLAVARRVACAARLQAAGLVVDHVAGPIGVQRTVLVAIVDPHPWLVDRQATGVGTYTVHLGVGIGEKPALQQPVFGGLDALDQVRRCQCDLLGFLEKVSDITVEHHLPNPTLGHVRPDFGGIQRVEIEIGQLLGAQCLDVQVHLG